MDLHRKLRFEEADLAGASTGVGSMPHAEVADALAAVEASAPLLPFWPQLPSRGPGEGMITQGLSGLDPWLRRDTRGPGFLVEDADGLLGALVEPAPWGVDQAAGLVAFTEALGAGRFSRARAVKGQLSGPLTLAACLSVGGAPAWQDPSIMRALGVRVAWQAVDQLVRLRRWGHRALIVLDEPMLGLLPAEALAPDSPAMEALSWALAAVQASGGIVGLHCCSDPPWSALARLPLDLVSFDAARHLDGLLASPEGLDLVQDRWVIWGLVPTDADPDALDPGALAAAWRARLDPLVDVNALARRALVSPSCGLAGVDPGRAVAALRLAGALGDQIRPSPTSGRSG